MPGVVPQTVYGYRITHYKNLPFILRNGMHCPSSDIKDPNYVNIGKKEIIYKREGKDVVVAPGGKIHDYVSFYFGPKSPMLYSIFKGNSDTDCSQSEIVYIVTTIPTLTAAKLQFVFTTGQAIMQLSTQHNDLKDLHKLDWDIISAKFWFDNPPTYIDRQRKRMAELLVYNYVPVNCILRLGTHTPKMKEAVEKMVYDEQLLISVDHIPNWYY